MKAIKAILWMLLTFFMPKEGLNELLRKQRPWQGRACRLGVQTCGVCDLGPAIYVDVNENTMKKIPLTHGKFTTVDDVDYEWLNQWKWHAHETNNIWYAARVCHKNGKNKRIYMHREITHALPKEEVDHKNQNSLANWRDNLRTCTHAENLCNQRPRKGCSSQFKGVHWFKRHKLWMAQITKNGKKYFLGYYKSEIDAAKVYDRKAIEIFGEYAHTNILRGSAL